MRMRFIHMMCNLWDAMTALFFWVWIYLRFFLFHLFKTVSIIKWPDLVSLLSRNHTFALSRSAASMFALSRLGVLDFLILSCLQKSKDCPGLSNQIFRRKICPSLITIIWYFCFFWFKSNFSLEKFCPSLFALCVFKFSPEKFAPVCLLVSLQIFARKICPSLEITSTAVNSM